MYINETLAKGLSSKLWDDLRSHRVAAIKEFGRYKRTHKAKGGARVAIQKHDQAMRLALGHSLLLASNKFGSRNTPFIAYSIFEQAENACREGWTEKMFLIRNAILDSSGHIRRYSPLIRVGEHAVARVFQRIPNVYNEEKNAFELLKIIPEFRSIAIYAEAMGIFFDVLKLIIHQVTQQTPHELSIPFISKHGLFLGDYNFENRHCDIRTFIADHQLTDLQRAVVDRVRWALSDETFSELPFLIFVEGIDNSALEMDFYSRLESVANEISQLMTWNIQQPDKKLLYQKLISTAFVIAKKNIHMAT